MASSNYLKISGVLMTAGLLASPMIAMPTPAAAQISLGVSVHIAPPILPIYVQPPIPAEGYLWTPGYWAWNDPVGYYWVPGTWIRPPRLGVLWTPPFWGWVGGAYIFHTGYWGPHIGFYGGVNYGFGYGGVGFEGGHWDGDHFAYNRTVNNFGSAHVTNVYDRNVTVINNTHVSYVGGVGGLRAEPTAEDRIAEHEEHAPMPAEQTSHITAAAARPGLAWNHNHGNPRIAAVVTPAVFKGPGVVRTERVHAEAGHRHHPEAHPASVHAEHPHLRPRPEDHQEKGSEH